MDNIEFRNSLPNNVSELKDIIELQRAELQEIRKKSMMYLSPKHINVTFNKSRPLDFG